MNNVEPDHDMYIVRAPMSDENDMPCAIAHRIPFKRVDVRTTDDPAKVSAYKGTVDWWYGKGENHRVENGRIVRDIGEVQEWVTYIPCVQDFVLENGHIEVGIEYNGWFVVTILGFGE